MPTAAGDHRFFCRPNFVAPAEPCTISMAASRTLPAAVLANAVRAGTIASSIGSAIVTPKPRSTARREMCFLVMNISLSSDYRPEAVVVSTAATRPIRNAALLATPAINDENL